MKRLLPFILLFSAQAFAMPFPTVKERLRLNMWHEGIGKKSVKKVAHNQDKNLPEELVRALRKNDLPSQ